MSGTRRKAGRLGPQVEGYRAWLMQRGYTPGTVRNMLKDLGQVGVWLSTESMDVTQLDEARIEAFLCARRATGHRHVPGTRGMVPLLSYLREVGAARPVQPSLTPLGELLVQYRCWMVQERNLAPATVLRYENTARRFLAEQALDDGSLRVGELTGADVNAFLLRECARVSAGSAKGRVAELRSLLRFLYLRQLLPLRLGAAVPPVGGWRLATIPVMVSTADVTAVLDSCDATTLQGVRNRAIMLLVARLGLRSIEVARLELDDIDWRRGELTVRGKARRQDRLPLPREVGEALSAYLVQRGEPGGLPATCSSPAVRHANRSAPTWSTTSWSGPAWPPASPGSGRTGCDTRWPVSCSARERACWRSARCCVIRTWPPQPSTPRSTWTRCAHRAALAGSQPGEPAEQALATTWRCARASGTSWRMRRGCCPPSLRFLERRDCRRSRSTRRCSGAQQPTPVGGVTVAPRRMTAARGFARYLAGIDPRPRSRRSGWSRCGITGAARSSTPTATSTRSLLSRGTCVSHPAARPTYYTLLGLLAATGMRIGEAINSTARHRLAEGVLLIRESKFGKSRLVPLRRQHHGALRHYLHVRTSVRRRSPGTQLLRWAHRQAADLRRSLTRPSGTAYVADRRRRRRAVPAAASRSAPPVRGRHPARLVSQGRTVQPKLPVLSTYLGHREPASTYWYLSAAPELLTLAAARRDQAAAGARS